MPTEPLVSIQTELAQIKTILLVVSALGGIALLLVILRGGFSLYRDFEKFMAGNFRRQAWELYEQNKASELKAFALERLADHPNHETARWYLAKALYLERDFDGALRELSEVERLCPSWKAEYIDPLVEKIGRCRTEGTGQ
jgi:hypothetical protein